MDLLSGAENCRGDRPTDVDVQAAPATLRIDYGKSGDAFRHTAHEKAAGAHALQTRIGSRVGADQQKDQNDDHCRRRKTAPAKARGIAHDGGGTRRDAPSKAQNGWGSRAAPSIILTLVL